MPYNIMLLLIIVSFLLTVFLIRMTHKRVSEIREKYLLFRKNNTTSKFVVSLTEVDHDLPIFWGETMYTPIDLIYFPELDSILKVGGVEINLSGNRVSSFSMIYLGWTLLMEALLGCTLLLLVYVINLKLSQTNPNLFEAAFLNIFTGYIVVLTLFTINKLHITQNYVHAVSLGVAENIMRQLNANGLYILPTETVNSFAKNGMTFTGSLRHPLITVDHIKITKLYTAIPEGVKVKLTKYVTDNV